MNNTRHNVSSLVVSAHHQQNLEIPSDKYPDAKLIDTRFPGHDDYQNGIIPNGQNCCFYVQATDQQIEDALNKNAHFSGFSTDAKECEKAIDPSTGKLDANVLSDRLQTAPWSENGKEPGTYRGNVAAFEVNWDALNDPKNRDLKEKLCNPDGLSAGNDDIKVAYGQTKANDHWGTGGGTQYYIDSATFNEAINQGVFQYQEDKSFRECNGTLQRKEVSQYQMNDMNDMREYNIQKTLNSCPDKNANSDIEKAKALNEMTPEKAEKINSTVAPEGDYLAKPDPAYHYGQTESTVPKSNSLSSENIVAITGGGTHAPPSSPQDKSEFSDRTKEKLFSKDEENKQVFTSVPKESCFGKGEQEGLHMGGMKFSKGSAQEKELDISKPKSHLNDFGASQLSI